jgi:uncharacterized repeat protein (TIGR02543 family)
MEEFSMNKLLKALLSFMIVMIGMAPSKGFAYTTGDGTEANPYQIVTIQDLKDMSLDLDAHYILNNDLDLTGVEWTPIGDETTPFSGVLDGNNHTISHLTLTKAVSLLITNHGSVETSDLDTYIQGYTGFFGVIDQGHVKNLTLSEASVDTSAMTIAYGDLASSFMVNDVVTGLLAGSIIGDGSTTTLENITILSSEIKSPVLDGFAGYYILANGVGSLSSIGLNVILKGIAVRDTKIKGMSGSAGLIGSVEGSVSVSESYFIGEIYGTYELGAFFGEAEGASDAPYTLTFSITQSFANVKLGSLADQAEDYVGGMVQQLSGYLSASFENVFVRGEIYSKNNDDGFSSGLVAQAYEIGTLSIQHAYVSVDINLEEEGNPAALFLGVDTGHYDEDWNQTGYATLDLVDLHADSTISDLTTVYAKYDSLNSLVVPFDSPVTLHTSTELKTLAHMTSTSEFDFENIWIIDSTINDGYPTFLYLFDLVTFDTGEGDFKIYVNHDDVFEKPEDPLKTDYVFEGWFTDETLTTPWNFETGKIQSDMTLYAKWSAKLPDTGEFSSLGGIFLILGLGLMLMTRKPQKN